MSCELSQDEKNQIEGLGPQYIDIRALEQRVPYEELFKDFRDLLKNFTILLKRYNDLKKILTDNKHT